MTVITYGTFDLLHYGHIFLLKRAAALGDRLIVGVSTDAFVAQKGKQVVFPLEKRMEMVRDLRFVDLVIPEQDMAQKIEDIRKYSADIFVLGSDYEKTFLEMPEYPIVASMCKVVFLPRTPSISTTALKKKLSNNA